MNFNAFDLGWAYRTRKCRTTFSCTLTPSWKLSDELQDEESPLSPLLQLPPRRGSRPASLVEWLGTSVRSAQLRRPSRTNTDDYIPGRRLCRSLIRDLRNLHRTRRRTRLRRSPTQEDDFLVAALAASQAIGRMIVNTRTRSATSAAEKDISGPHARSPSLRR